MGKAVIFSLAALLIVILFVSSSSLVSKFRISETELEVTRTRVKILNSVVNDFENSYFEKLLYIASKNALVGLSEYYSESNFESPNVRKSLELAMNDVIYQGILNDNHENFQKNLTGYIDYSYTFSGLMSNISLMMDKLGLEMTSFNITISPIDGIKQADPWTIQVKGEFFYFISDKEGIASWKGSSAKIVNVSVIGLYLYDREGGSNSISNKEIITSLWKVDNGTITEDSAVSKLNGKGTGRGICKDYCQEN